MHYAWNGLPHGLYLEVKTHVSGFGKGKEDLPFKLGEVVLYRPDLAVQSIQYPTVVRPNTFVTFQTVVAERMRDVGAHTDCELLVDGTRVDVVPQIWVDANSAVTCRLTYKFTSAGKHSIAVRAAHVTPGDFDTANNEMSAENINRLFNLRHDRREQVRNPVEPGKIDALRVDDDDPHVLRGFCPEKSSDQRIDRDRLTRAGCSGDQQMRESSEIGQNRLTGYVTPEGNATSCASGDPAFPVLTTITINDDASNGQVLLRVYQNPDTGAGRTTVDVSWSYSDALYVSSGYCNSVAATSFGCTAGDFVITTPLGTAGVKLALGSNYSANVVVDDGTAYTAQPNMQLTTTHQVQPLSDPFCFSTSIAAALVRFFAGRHDAVVTRCRHVIDMDPDYAPARRLTAAALEQMGQALPHFHARVCIACPSAHALTKFDNRPRRCHCARAEIALDCLSVTASFNVSAKEGPRAEPTKDRRTDRHRSPGRLGRRRGRPSSSVPSTPEGSGR